MRTCASARVHVCVGLCLAVSEEGEEKNILQGVKMERLVVGFVGGLPRFIKRYRQEGESSIMPKAKRQAALQFMTQHSRRILKNRRPLGKCKKVDEGTLIEMLS